MTTLTTGQRRRGPTWTQARLRRVMLLRFGPSRRGSVSVAAAAQAMEVSPSTIRRWLAGDRPRAAAPIPAPRLAQLIALLLPSPTVLADEAKQAAYVRQSMHQLDQGGQPLGTWVAQGWMSPHVVAIVARPKLGVRQVAFTALDPLSRDRLKRYGAIDEAIVVKTRVHAMVLVHQVLDVIGPWRYAASPRDVKVGRTRAWLDDAPSVSLAAQAAALHLDVEQLPEQIEVDR